MSHTSRSYLSRTLFDLPFFATSRADALKFIRSAMGDKELLTIATPNPEQIVQAQRDSAFKKTLQEFELFLPDGQGIIWASKILGKPLEERLTGIDILSELLKVIKKEGLTVLIVGGKDLVVSEKFPPKADQPRAGQVASDQTNERFTRIEVQNTQLYWYRDFDKQNALDTTNVLSWIEQNHPEIVFVALGAPHQEEWVIAYRNMLQKAGVKVVMVVGGAFDVLTGKMHRAPELIQKLGFEWSWRLLQQPWRWRRQLRLVEFVQLVVTQLGQKSSK